MDSSWEKISQVIWTKGDAEIALEYIDSLNNSLYGLDNKSFESVAEKLPEERISQTIIAEIRNVPEDLRRNYLRELVEAVKTSETMKLTVAVRLSRETIGEIVDELRGKWEKIIVEIEVNPEIVGGAMISWRGKFWEKTLYDKI